MRDPEQTAAKTSMLNHGYHLPIAACGGLLITLLRVLAGKTKTRDTNQPTHQGKITVRRPLMMIRCSQCHCPPSGPMRQKRGFS